MFLNYTDVTVGACSVYKSSETLCANTGPCKLHLCSMVHSAELFWLSLVAIRSMQGTHPPRHTVLSCLYIILLSIRCDVTVFPSDSNHHYPAKHSEFTLAEVTDMNVLGYSYE